LKVAKPSIAKNNGRHDRKKRERDMGLETLKKEASDGEQKKTSLMW